MAKRVSRRSPAPPRETDFQASSPTGGQRSEKKRGTKPPPDPCALALADQLIAPKIAEFAERVRSGAIPSEERAKPVSYSRPLVPPALEPFFDSPCLQRLVEALQRQPGLYWHPLVEAQVAYLLALHRDEAEWQRLGWKRRWDRDLKDREPPDEVALASEALKMLLEGHVRSLRLGTRIEGRRSPGRRGPKGVISNPYPIGPETEEIDGADLDETFREMKALFEEQLGRRKGGLKAEAKARYRTLAQEVLAAVNPWWSGFKEPSVVPTEATAAPEQSPRAGPESFADWLSWKVTESTVPRWRPLVLDDALDRLLGQRMGRKEGKSAYLAHAVLGELLWVTPEKIRDTLQNYRAAKRSPRRSTS